MPFDRNDHQALLAKRDNKLQQDMMPLIQVLQRAAPVMQSMMTGSDAWDRFLTILQGFSDRINASKNSATASMADPTLWEPYQLAKIKSDIIVCIAMLDILKTVMELPKALIEGGEAANELVNKFEADHATAEQPKS